MTQPTLINPHPDEYTKGLRYYQFAVKLDRCARICNTLNDLSNRVDIPNKTYFKYDYRNKWIKSINKIIKDISCKCECKFDGRKYNSNQKQINDECLFTKSWCIKPPKNII